MKRLSPEQKENILSLRERGKGVKFIAGRVRCSPGAVLYHCLCNGLDPFNSERARGTHAGAFSAEEDAKLIELARSGMKLHHVAAALKRPRTSTRMRLLLLEVRAEKALAQ